MGQLAHHPSQAEPPFALAELAFHRIAVALILPLPLFLCVQQSGVLESRYNRSVGRNEAPAQSNPATFGPPPDRVRPAPQTLPLWRNTTSTANP